MTADPFRRKEDAKAQGKQDLMGNAKASVKKNVKANAGGRCQGKDGKREAKENA